MNSHQKDLLKLIYAAISKEKMKLSDDFSIAKLMPLIKAHDLHALCYYGALECGISSDTEEMQSLFEQVCSHIFVSELQKKIAGKIFTLFDDNGIEYMPLKGILLKELYTYPEMRAMGDLDILIKLEQYPKIKELLVAREYTEVTESDHELIWMKKNIHIELHKRLIPSYNKDYYAYFGDGWSLAVPEYGTRYKMDDEDQLIYLFTHLAKHYRNGGIGIKQMVDLYLYRKSKPNMDMDRIRKAFTSLSLLDFYDNVCHTLSVWFESGEANEISELVSDTIFRSGVFGTRESHLLAEGVQITATSGEKNAKKKKFMKTVFLPYADMCKKYSFLKRLPFLLPIMWIVRIFNALLFKRKTVKKNLDDLSVMKKDEIDKQRDALAQVGLAFNFEE